MQKTKELKKTKHEETQATTEDILFCLFQDVFFGVRSVACRSNKVATFLLQIINRIFNKKKNYSMNS